MDNVKHKLSSVVKMTFSVSVRGHICRVDMSLLFLLSLLFLPHAPHRHPAPGHRQRGPCVGQRACAQAASALGKTPSAPRGQGGLKRGVCLSVFQREAGTGTCVKASSTFCVSRPRRSRPWGWAPR